MAGRGAGLAFLLLAAWAVLGPALAAAAADPIDPVVPEAIAYYDSCADRTKRQIHRKVADASDPQRDGTLDRTVAAPPRFGVLRLYPKAYDLARRVARLPLAQQQRIWDHVHAHQVRSGWIAAPAAPVAPPAAEKPADPAILGPPSPAVQASAR